MPYPEQCLYHLSQPENLVINGAREFLTKMIKAAAIEVMRVGKIVKVLESNYITKEKETWSDCSKLYDLASIHLNNILDVSNNHTDSDTQTWLSAASTNTLICQRGFSPSVVQNLLSNNNITALIRNSLFVNQDWSEKALDYNIRQHLPNLNGMKASRPLFFKAHIKVAKDGTGKYKTINEAITDLRGWRRTNHKKYVIYVKSGVYYEKIIIPVDLKNLVLVGDGINKTIISGDRTAKEIGIFGSATLGVYGPGFIAKSMSFLNTADPKNGQAIAVASVSDCSVFYQCSIEGHQDTLFAGSGRQFYRESVISGTVDFIYGNAAAVFQKCIIKTRPRGQNVITAHGRDSPFDNTGFSFQYSMIIPSNKTFLGRPWRTYARTAFVQSYFNKNVDRAGWLKFDEDSDVDNLCYREYSNFGPGSSVLKRVNWNGYRVMGYMEAQQYSVSMLIDGSLWLPSTKVPHEPWI